jgi:hypothetical protein
MGVPDELAIVLSGGNHHAEFSDARRQRCFRSQVKGESERTLCDFRGVKHHGTRPGSGNFASLLYQTIVCGSLVFWDIFSRQCGNACHFSPSM